MTQVLENQYEESQPCIFCGSSDVDYNFSTNTLDQEILKSECRNCGAEGESH